MSVNKDLSTREVFNLGEITKDSLATDVYYDRVSRRYKYKSNNTFASRADVITLQKKFLSKKEREFVRLSGDILSGKIGVYKDLAKTLKQIHLSNAIIERGGIDRLTNSDLGIIGNILKQQYYSGRDEVTGQNYGLKYLLRDAPSLSEARLKQRLRLYVESAKVTAYALERATAVAAGLRYAQRFLNPAEHCNSCIYYASLGKQLVETLPLPKTRCECRSNCKCTIQYYEN